MTSDSVDQRELIHLVLTPDEADVLKVVSTIGIATIMTTNPATLILRAKHAGTLLITDQRLAAAYSTLIDKLNALVTVQGKELREGDLFS